MSTLSTSPNSTGSNSTNTKSLGPNYDRAAWFYDRLSKLYSMNQIRASKRSQLKFLKPGSKVIYLGVGGVNEAVHAARMGCEVTCVDISQGMLDRLKRRLDEERLSAELICQSAFDHNRTGYYDAVATNYFLNVFREPVMEKMMQHASTLVRTGGRFMIADVSLPQGNVAYKLFNWCYVRWAMATCWMIGMVPWHKNYDYPAYFKDANLGLDQVEFFRLAKFGPIVFENIIATKL